MDVHICAFMSDIRQELLFLRDAGVETMLMLLLMLLPASWISKDVTTEPDMKLNRQTCKQISKNKQSHP